MIESRPNSNHQPPLPAMFLSSTRVDAYVQNIGTEECLKKCGLCIFWFFLGELSYQCLLPRSPSTLDGLNFCALLFPESFLRPRAVKPWGFLHGEPGIAILPSTKRPFPPHGSTGAAPNHTQPSFVECHLSSNTRYRHSNVCATATPTVFVPFCRAQWEHCQQEGKAFGYGLSQRWYHHG